MAEEGRHQILVGLRVANARVLGAVVLDQQRLIAFGEGAAGSRAVVPDQRRQRRRPQDALRFLFRGMRLEPVRGPTVVRAQGPYGATGHGKGAAPTAGIVTVAACT